ncbi:RadC family protein [Paenibacillus validus]|uniref:RadC family protein n=1 Tax=Paenibacillus validus TaxID=44253 RepID=UPI003D2E4CE4
MTSSYSYKSIIAATLRDNESNYTIHELLSRFSSPHDLLEATESELLQIKGIGPAKARQLIAAVQLALMINQPKVKPPVIRSPQDVFTLLRHEIGYLKHERFIAIMLDTKNGVISTETISIGGLNSAIVTPRELFKMAIRKSACSIVAAHNHPSNDPTPSPEDVQLTERIVEVGELVGIEIIDHCVITADSFYSMKEHGLM